MMVYPTLVPGNPVQTKPQPLTTDYCLPARPSRAESLERPRLKEKFNIDNYDSGLEDLVRRELSQLLAERYSVDVGVVNDQEGRTAGDYDVLIQNLIWAPVVKLGATPDSRRFHYPIESIYSAFEVKQTLHLGFSLVGEPLEHLGHCDGEKVPAALYDRLTDTPTYAGRWWGRRLV